MLSTNTSTDTSVQGVQLAPNYALPIVLVLLALPLLLVQVWLAIAISLFGLFLLYQSTVIRLVFTATALDVYRSESLIRRFPYQEWQDWKIFWERLPILFYFKEIKSIHFLPILFDAKTLRACLEQYCANL
jgi:hypothetical protein